MDDVNVLVPLALGVGLLVLLGAREKVKGPAGGGGGWGAREDDGRPILVVGDSFAVGVAAALRRLYPGRDVRTRAAVGRPATAMQALEQGPYFVILSAGSNDAAGSAPVPAIRDAILKVMGPYAPSHPDMAYLMPHDRMGGYMGERIRQLRGMLKEAGVGPSAVELPLPEASDHIHFSPKGYENIARHAMLVLAPGTKNPAA